mmetsp:Transcript_979/g.2297  ORF Transcript_979/g.2297 Transcript_979/m.2297 type:complete len:281 (+) Transcript_979:72-914(+)
MVMVSNKFIVTAALVAAVVQNHEAQAFVLLPIPHSRWSARRRHASTSTQMAALNDEVDVELEKLKKDLQADWPAEEEMSFRSYEAKTERPPQLLGFELTKDDASRFADVSDMFLVVASAFGLCELMNSLLINNEIMQAWRYSWPMIGLVFSFEGIRALTSSEGANGIEVTCLRGRSSWVQSAVVFAGLGLVVGGAADALLPVYVTGPNLVTAAGLAPDCALILIFVQLTCLAEKRASLELVIRSVSLAQLEILAAGSADELSSRVVEGVVSAAATTSGLL